MHNLCELNFFFLVFDFEFEVNNSISIVHVLWRSYRFFFVSIESNLDFITKKARKN